MEPWENLNDASEVFPESEPLNIQLNKSMDVSRLAAFQVQTSSLNINLFRELFMSFKEHNNSLFSLDLAA